MEAEDRIEGFGYDDSFEAVALELSRKSSLCSPYHSHQKVKHNSPNFLSGVEISNLFDYSSSGNEVSFSASSSGPNCDMLENSNFTFGESEGAFDENGVSYKSQEKYRNMVGEGKAGVRDVRKMIMLAREKTKKNWFDLSIKISKQELEKGLTHYQDLVRKDFKQEKKFSIQSCLLGSLLFQCWDHEVLNQAKPDFFNLEPFEFDPRILSLPHSMSLSGEKLSENMALMEEEEKMRGESAKKSIASTGVGGVSALSSGRKR